MTIPIESRHALPRSRSAIAAPLTTGDDDAGNPGLGLNDSELSSLMLMLVEPVNCGLGLVIGLHLDKGETLATVLLAVQDDSCASFQAQRARLSLAALRHVFGVGNDVARATACPGGWRGRPDRSGTRA